MKEKVCDLSDGTATGGFFGDGIRTPFTLGLRRRMFSRVSIHSTSRSAGQARHPGFLEGYLEEHHGIRIVFYD